MFNWFNKTEAEAIEKPQPSEARRQIAPIVHSVDADSFKVEPTSRKPFTEEQRARLNGEIEQSFERVLPHAKEIERNFFQGIHVAVQAQREANVTAPHDPSKFDPNTGNRIVPKRTNELDSLSQSIPLQEQRAELGAAAVIDYKALYEVVAAQHCEALAQLRYAAIREERVQRMMQMIEARTGAKVSTDSQGNVLVIAPDGETTMLPTGYTGQARQLPEG